MREHRLLRQAIESFELDLDGFHVLTEAASGPFLWTPLLAAAAGARVVAVGASSVHGSFEAVREATLEQARRLGVEDAVEIVEGRSQAAFAGAELVTNLGPLRPFDAEAVGWLEPGSVIALMWEPWELRPGEIDLAACKARNVPVIGTNERDPRLRTFDAVAGSIAKRLFGEGIEILHSRILVLGSGPFVDATAPRLEALGARVELHAGGGTPPTGHFDALVCLEHRQHERLLIGPGGWLAPDTPLETDLVLHVCGGVDAESIRRRGWPLVPPQPAPVGYMSFTTAALGPRPVIDLHAAGLRVAAACRRGEREVLEALALPVWPESTAGSAR